MKNFIAFVMVVFTTFIIPSASARNLTVADDVSDPLTLDPQKQFSDKNHTLCQQMFDGLVRFDPDGKIEPALAVSWERVDPTRMRFKLREGVVFHNGEPFDSETVKFTIERYLDPATGFPARGFIDSIDRVETPDKFTADIITKYPDGLLLNRLAGFVLMVPPRYIREKGAENFAANPIGTGAFIFKSWEKGGQISMTANTGYWLKGYPKLDGLIFKFIPQEKQLDALFDGTIDLVTTLPGPQTLKVMRHPHTTVMKKVTFYTVVASMNRSTGPLSDLDVRKAMNYALDKTSLIRYDLLGNGRPIATISMEGEIGHNRSLMPYKFDPVMAKKLLKKAGYPDGFKLEVLVKTNAERTARVIATNLAEAGIKMNITVGADADMIRELGSGKYDMAFADVPDPMYHSYFIAAIILYSKSPYALSGDTKFDAMLGDMSMTIDPVLMRKKAEKLDEYIYANAMSLFTYQRIALYGINRDLVFTPYLSGMPYFYKSHFINSVKRQ